MKGRRNGRRAKAVIIGKAETCLRRGRGYSIVLPVISPFLNGVKDT